MRGEDQYRSVGVFRFRAHSPYHLDTIYPGHCYIRDDQIRFFEQRAKYPFSAITGINDRKACVSKIDMQQVESVAVIFDNQYFQHGGINNCSVSKGGKGKDSVVPF